MKKVSGLYSYPIKSTGTQSHKTANVNTFGLEGDREWAIIDAQDKCVTSREHPKLMHLNCCDDSEYLIINYKNEEIAKIERSDFEQGAQIDFNVHTYTAHGRTSSAHPANEWLGKFINTECQLVLLDNERQRPVLSKHGGSPRDIVGFSDQAPILIISEASLTEVNSKLEVKIEMNRFRPNIVISNCEAFEEDTWKEIKIGGIRLRIIQACERCVLITIDPTTLVKHTRAEPLTTLSKYRIGPRGGIIFGVHAVPITEGTINLEDPLEVIK